jgi:hypothetical protein
MLSFWARESTAQIEISILDTALWRVDTIDSKPVVTPLFQLISDTVLTFNNSEHPQERLTLTYKEGAGFMIGDFSDSIGIQCVYLQLNTPYDTVDYSTFLSLVDTVFPSGTGRSYAIRIETLGIRNESVKEVFKNWGKNGLITLSWFNRVYDLEYCLYRVVFILEYNPPYETVIYTQDAVIRNVPNQ